MKSLASKIEAPFFEGKLKKDRFTNLAGDNVSASYRLQIEFVEKVKNARCLTY